MIRKFKLGECRPCSRKTDPTTDKRRDPDTFKTREAAEWHERWVQYLERRGCVAPLRAFIARGV